MLICDLAETYGIFDYKSMPARLIATLTAGLRENSRIKQKQSKLKASKTDLMLAFIADLISMMSGIEGIWTEWITGIERNKNTDNIEVFNSVDAYESARKKILEGRV